MPPFKNPEDKRRYQKEYFRDYYAKPEKKAQVKKAVRSRKRNLRDWYLRVKAESTCSICGMTGENNPWAMEFHHEDPSQKTDIVSRLVGSGYSRKRIMQEIQKCVIVCANCHRAEHYRDKIENGKSMFEEAGQRQNQPSTTDSGKRGRRRRAKEREKRRNQRLQDKDEKAPDFDESQ